MKITSINSFLLPYALLAGLGVFLAPAPSYAQKTMVHASATFLKAASVTIQPDTSMVIPGLLEEGPAIVCHSQDSDAPLPCTQDAAAVDVIYL